MPRDLFGDFDEPRPTGYETLAEALSAIRADAEVQQYEAGVWVKPVRRVTNKERASETLKQTHRLAALQELSENVK